MSGFASGLGFLILCLVLLFAWLAVAVFVSAELAFAIGLALVVLWTVLFLPVGFIKEMIWQARQKKIMQHAMAAAPAYQAGSALPPPMAGNALAVVSQSAGGAIDVYRDDLPQLLPQLEPRDHALAFKRSLVLPVLGILMMIGASNETFMQALLEARGMMQKLPIAWEELKLPAQYANKRSEMNEAARVVLRREGNCSKVVSGALAPRVQFKPQADQIAQIKAGDYVYEFYCLPSGQDAKPYLTFITPAEIDRGSFASLSASFDSHLREADALAACHAAGNKALEAMGATLAPASGDALVFKPEVIPGRMPYADYVRVISVEGLSRNDLPSGNVAMSCWVDSHGTANVRFSRVN